MFERTFPVIANYYPDSINDCVYFFDSIYVISITMLSIGYGERHPATYQGRLVLLSTGVIGTFLIAIVIRVVSENYILAEREKKIVDLLKGMEIKKNKMETVVRML